MSSFRVPAVDVAAYVGDGTAEERELVAREIDTACREVGFIQIHGHGVPDEVVAGLGLAMDAFFALDPEEKSTYVRPPGENRGYTPPRSESLSLSLGIESAGRMNDFFEAYNVGCAASELPGQDPAPEHFAENTWPDLPGFEPQVTAYRAEAERVARTMTRIFADALGLPEGFLEALTSPSIGVLRMNHYALTPGTEVSLDGDLVGMSEHTDYGIVTVLWADRVRGLQVLGSEGVWHDVSPEPGALLINLGDLTARLTNERWMSTLHRVKPPIVDGTVERRRSAAYFHDGDPAAVVAPIPGCVDADHPALYDPVTVDEHIRAKLAGSRVGRRNDAAVRESARVRRAQSRTGR